MSLTQEQVEQDIPEKHCDGCGRTKPIREFRWNLRWKIHDAKCRSCRDKRNKTRARTINRRLRQRATAALVQEQNARFKELMKELRPIVEDEFDLLGEDPNVILKPGPKRREEDSVLERIKEECDECGSLHQRGHRCEVCGSAPGDPQPLPEKIVEKVIRVPFQLPTPARPGPGSRSRRTPDPDSVARRQRLAQQEARILADRAKGAGS